MNTSPFDQECLHIRLFQRKFGQITNDQPTHLTRRKLTERIECMAEELSEFREAADQQDLAGMADALVDLVYFAKGTAMMMGLPWTSLWLDVQRANMAKEAGVGKRGHLIDCVKPEGWVPPQTRKILAAAGYQRGHFTMDGRETSSIDERRCCDDQIHK